MIVLGLDPSLTAYGWAIVERSDADDRAPALVVAAGCLRTAKDNKKTHGYAVDDDSRRILDLCDGLRDALVRARAANVPGGQMRVVCESPPGSAKGSRAVKALAWGLALTLATMRAERMRVRLVQPHEVKRALGGALAASKDEVAAAVLLRTGWTSSAKTKPEREAEHDAAAVALTLRLEELT